MHSTHLVFCLSFSCFLDAGRVLKVKCPHKFLWLNTWLPDGGAALEGHGGNKNLLPCWRIEASRNQPWSYTVWPHFFSILFLLVYYSMRNWWVLAIHSSTEPPASMSAQPKWNLPSDVTLKKPFLSCFVQKICLSKEPGTHRWLHALLT